MILTNSQFYDVVQYGESKGLDPKVFNHVVHKTYFGKSIFGKEYEEPLSVPYSEVRINNTECYFKVDLTIYGFKREDRSLSYLRTYSTFGQEKSEDTIWHDTYFHVHFSPGRNQHQETYKRVGYRVDFNWGLIFDFCKVWVDNLVDELHAIESLKRINMIPEYFYDKRSGLGGDWYSQSESSTIRSKVHLLKSRVIDEIPLDKDQMSIIIEKLDELSDKVDKVNKFDFRTLYFGILTNIASSVLYDYAPEFWGIVKMVFDSGGIEGGGPGLLV
jgi:hypothetical protein